MKKLAIAILLVLPVFLAGCFSNNNLSVWPQDDGTLQTKRVLPAKGKTENRILILDIDGIITEMGQGHFFYSEEPTTFEVRQKLDRALRDDSIKAVVLRINSPGGGANASDIVYQEIVSYKEQSRVPIVAMMMGVAASGGYYAACAADRIYAHPNTVTGSIGVISFGLGFDGLFEKIGMESRVVSSGPLKDMGNPFDKWTDEEKKATQKIIDGMFDRFVKVVADSRSMKPERVREISDGRVMLSREAEELGLIDDIGYFGDALDEAMSLAQIRDAEVILYTKSSKQDRNLYADAGVQGDVVPNMGGLTLNNLSAEALLELARPQVMYLWLGN